MKKIFCLLLILVMLGSIALADEGLTKVTTTDMEGHTVTQDIFADYDLTVVNVWATWCGPCLSELPELPKLKTMLPENVNFITLCCDASADMKLAGEILRSAGANFQTLVVNQELMENFVSYISAIPTTCFVDSEGNLLVTPLVGVPSATDPAGAYYDITMSVLALMEEAE